jgi:hypothetical protein
MFGKCGHIHFTIHHPIPACERDSKIDECEWKWNGMELGLAIIVSVIVV